jgi:hypothetical protein
MIYDTLHNHGCNIVIDNSDWQRGRQDSSIIGRPLWLVVEAKRINRRLWITKVYGRLSVTTARLDLDGNSREYSSAQTREYFCTQREMALYLDRILSGDIALESNTQGRLAS